MAKDLEPLRRELLKGGKRSSWDDNISSEKAAQALAEIGGDEAYDILAGGLGCGNFGHGDFTANEAGYNILRKLGSRVTPTLIRVLGNPYPDTRLAAANLLSFSGEKTFRNFIKGDLKDLQRIAEGCDRRVITSMIEALLFYGYNKYQIKHGTSDETYSGWDWIYEALKMIDRLKASEAMETLTRFRERLIEFKSYDLIRKVDEIMNTLKSNPIGDLATMTDKVTAAHNVSEDKLIDKETLIRAAYHGDVDALRALLVRGVNANAEDTSGLVALHVAAERGKVEVAKTLIAAGADVNIRSGLGDTPLHFAAIGRQPEIVRVLLAAGANVNAKGYFGWTPLRRAVGGGGENIELVKLLLSAGADVNLTDHNRETIFSVWTMQEETRDLLLERRGKS